MKKTYVGQIVHFVQNNVHYAAMVVKVWSNTCVNLQVFPNGSDPITAGATDQNGIAHSVNFAPVAPTEWSWHPTETEQ